MPTIVHTTAATISSQHNRHQQQQRQHQNHHQPRARFSSPSNTNDLWNPPRSDGSDEDESSGVTARPQPGLFQTVEEETAQYGESDGQDHASFRSVDGVTERLRKRSEDESSNQGSFDEEIRGQIPDEYDDDDDDDDVGGDGENRVELVQIPYRIILRRYLLVPLLALICFGGTIALLTFAWPPPPDGENPYPHRPKLAHFLVGVAFYSLAHSLRIPIATILSPLPLSASSLQRTSTALHTFVLEILRLASISIFLPPLQVWESNSIPETNSLTEVNTSVSVLSHNHLLPYPSVWDQRPVFASAAWLGLGWAAGEVTVGIWQAFSQLGFYRPVLPDVGGGIELGHGPNEGGSLGLEGIDVRRDIIEEVDDDDDDDDEESEQQRERERLEEGVWELIAVQKREEIESLLGVPLPNIPAIILALWRIDSLLLNIGITLIFSALFSTHREDGSAWHIIKHMLPLFTAVAGGHIVLSLVWVSGIPTLGAPTTTYASLLVALAIFFWGLGTWEALI
ncbi:hypothetical protein [Phaffia rhodozyma]|uniref:Uncharacterized protein n=1 Tax=Phaffia rhodozyma TaxID=264483 RepID=A0A0F7SQ59_PHARH|nr:hypothetical protein [Phaffia rhodozyma]